jgi:hypothetical protein
MRKQNFLMAAAFATLTALHGGGCAVEPDTAEVQSRLDAENLWEILDVQDEGPEAKVGFLVIGGDPNLVGRLNQLRGNLGHGTADITLVNQLNQIGSPPATVSGQQAPQEEMTQALAITASAAKLVVAQADSENEADLAAATDALVNRGVTAIGGVFTVGGAMTNLGPSLAAARAANIRIVFSMGTAGYQTSPAHPLDQTDAFGVGIAIPTFQNNTWTFAVYGNSGATASKSASLALPGSGPVYNGSFVTTTNSPAYAVGLALGVFARDESIQVPGDFTGKASRFHDVTSGSVGTCSPSSLCTASAGVDGPSGFGIPKASQF